MRTSVQFRLAVLGLIALSTIRSAEGADDGALKLTAGETEVRKHLSADEYEITTIRLWPGEVPDDLTPKVLGGSEFTAPGP